MESTNGEEKSGRETGLKNEGANIVYAGPRPPSLGNSSATFFSSADRKHTS